MNLDDDKNQFLLEFLKNAPFEGWSEQNIEISSKNLKNNLTYGYIIFSNGIEEINQYFSDFIDSHMLSILSKEHLNFLRISEKIERLVFLRLSLYQPYKEAIRSFINYNKNPLNLLSSTQLLWKTCDNIWNICGDNSTDMNYYSKRLVLCCVYSRTLLYWLDDHSEQNEQTKIYLTQQIKEVLKIGKIKHNLSKFKKDVTNLPFIRLLFLK